MAIFRSNFPGDAYLTILRHMDTDVSNIAGSITSQMTLSQRSASIQSIGDISFATAVAVESSVWPTTFALLNGTGVTLVACGVGNDISECGKLLREGKVDVVVRNLMAASRSLTRQTRLRDWSLIVAFIWQLLRVYLRLEVLLLN